MSMTIEVSRQSHSRLLPAQVRCNGSQNREPKFMSGLPTSFGRNFYFLYLSPITFVRNARSTSTIHRAIAFFGFMIAVYGAGYGLDISFNEIFDAIIAHHATERTGYAALQAVVGFDRIPKVLGLATVALCLGIAVSGTVARRLWTFGIRNRSIISSLNEAIYRTQCTGSLILFYSLVIGVGLLLFQLSYGAPSHRWAWDVFAISCVCGIPALMHSKWASAWKRQREKEVERLMPSGDGIGACFRHVLAVTLFFIVFPSILAALVAIRYGIYIVF